MPDAPGIGQECRSSAQGIGLVSPEVLQSDTWDALLAGNGSSFFHTRGWAQILQETYGHRPAYFGVVSDDKLQSLLPVMEVCSPWTGRRGVSLPFTDFCNPITANAEIGRELYRKAVEHGRQRKWRYLEVRGDFKTWSNAAPSLEFVGHCLNLDGNREQLFRSLAASAQRAIRKAEREGVRVDFRQDLEGMRQFYQLHCWTRKRHGVPPQPFSFFEKIVTKVLARNRGFITTATCQNLPIASAVFFFHEHEAIYKFGASDESYQRLRPNTLIMWRSIARLNEMGGSHLHLGRTSVWNSGLRRFKKAFGAEEHPIKYARYDYGREKFVSSVDRAKPGIINQVIRLMPPSVLRFLGKILYPHLS